MHIPFILGVWLVAANCSHAQCFDGVTGPMPTRITEASGQILEVTDRTANRLRYTRRTGGVWFEMTVQSGVFLITSRSSDGDEVLIDWDDDLPGLSDFKPAAAFAASAALRQTSRAMLPVEFAIKVLAEEEISIAGCVYPVLKIETTEEVGSNPPRVELIYLHIPTQTVLATEQVIDGVVQKMSRVVALD